MDIEHSKQDFLAPLPGSGEMGERILALDWSKTPVGPMASWPQSLKTMVQTMLRSRYAMWLGWGPELTFFYNDAYAQMTLGSKHPWALGQPAREVWPEIWNDIGPRAESVLRTGEATWDERLLLLLKRRGFPEETYHTFSYSPIPDDGGIGGMLCVVTEDTDQVIGERRLRTLQELAAHTTDEVRSAEDACQIAAHTLAGNPYDLPFILIYLLDDDERQARLAGLSGISRDILLSPTAVDLEGQEEGPWPFRQVIEKRSSVEVKDLHQPLGSLPGGVWPESPQQAILLPVAKPGQTQLAGFLVAGISPRRPFDEAYRGFLVLLSGQIAAAIASARAYEEERHRAETLAKLDQAKTAFFSNISHEFRTPLTLILGPVEDLLTDNQAELPSAAKEQLALVSRNGQRLLRLVNTLLEFSRFEASRVKAVYRPTDLAAFTIELASLFRSACEQARLRLTIDCPKVSEPVYVDREMWEKIVLNLLSNAFKFTFEGEITVMLQQVGNTAELRVRDTGTGITAEEMSRLFERFHRIEKARGRTHEGSGIGLALVQELIKLHGGSIRAESIAGQGTTFIVTLPLGCSHLPSERIENNDTIATVWVDTHPFVEEALRWLPHDGQKGDDLRFRTAIPGDLSSIQNIRLETTESDDRPRVLVVDDSADMRQYLMRLLAERYHVEEVSDGEAALAVAREQMPDLILADVMMPRLDGFGLLRELRADPRTKELPVIMLSARAGEEDRIDGMEAQADDYLVKPFSARELLARVGGHLQMARLRREANESLRQSKEQLEAALMSSATGTFRWNPHTGEFLEFDENLKRLFGFTADEPVRVTEDFIAKVHPGDMPKLISAMNQCRQGADFEMEYRVVLPDGGIRWLYDRAKMIGDEQSKPIYLVGACTDITERKQAEQALQEERDLLRVTLASIGDAVIATDIEGRITSLNIVAEALTGWTNAEATGQPLDNVFRIVNEETRWTVENPATRALREGIVVGLANHTVLIRKDGTERSIDDSAAPIRGEQDQVIGCVLVFRDITERKQSERRARENERQFRMLIEQIKDYAIFVTDPQGRATSWNEGVKHVLGFEEADFLGRDIVPAIFTPEDVQNGMAQQELEKAAASGSISGDRWMMRKDGTRFFATGITTALHEESGRLVGFMRIMRDQTKQKHLEEDLRQVAANLSEANRRKTEFLATLGHELRNPLAPIRTGLELMGMMANNPARLEEIRSMMERQIQQLVRLTDDLLDVSRITQGKFQLRTCQVVLADIIQSAVEASLPFIEESGHKLVITMPPQPILLEADPSRLAQVLSNLLSNSAKYTPEGGHIGLTAERQGSDVMITVRDNGIGIPTHMQIDIFEMFTQVERSLEKGYQGLGIGLTLVKQLVEMHGGEVKAHSEGEGKGSEFSVRLPRLVELSTAKLKSALSKAAAKKTRLRILIVDDNKAAADMLGMMVKMLGNDICVAYNGMQAIEAGAKFRPNIILMDLGMPEMNGYEAARYIREQEWGRDVALVALTGWGQDEDRQRTKEAGFNHHLVKPAEPAVLQNLFADIEPDPV